MREKAAANTQQQRPLALRLLTARELTRKLLEMNNSQAAFVHHFSVFDIEKSDKM